MKSRNKRDERFYRKIGKYQLLRKMRSYRKYMTVDFWKFLSSENDLLIGIDGFTVYISIHYNSFKPIESPKQTYAHSEVFIVK